eukprot:gene7016-11181_t
MQTINKVEELYNLYPEIESYEDLDDVHESPTSLEFITKFKNLKKIDVSHENNPLLEDINISSVQNLTSLQHLKNFV